MRFEFDRELFISNVYEKTFRGALKASLQKIRENETSSEKGNTSALAYEAREAKKRSQAIDRQIRMDLRWLRQERNILLLGSEYSGKSQVFREMKIKFGDGYPKYEAIHYLHIVHMTVNKIAKTFVHGMTQIESLPRSTVVKDLYDSLRLHLADSDEDEPLPLDGAKAEVIDALYRDPVFEVVLEQSQDAFFKKAAP